MAEGSNGSQGEKKGGHVTNQESKEGKGRKKVANEGKLMQMETKGAQ